MAAEQTAVILWILFISLGMVILGQVFNKLFGLTREDMTEQRERAQNLQERMKNAQIVGDPQLMRELQQESMQLTKDMMKKQMLPMCIRCFLFIGIFAVIGVIFAQYGSGLLPFEIPLFGSGWFALYFLFSIGFSLLFYASKKIYKKYWVKEDSKKNISQEIMGMLSSSQETPSSGFDLSATAPIADINSGEPRKTEEKAKSTKKDSWKDKIQ
ncbi:MAG: DUF106 domain-containing protein [Candidatus Lokiarchaeota archaeon]|nr:DUF106 domain-containing protein [Candidatus Lokiarchaeota archaeon]MBD3199381.1 DUF106 domain-containing protein [Candidatus Lokiarchaeota archaeon]